jgi:hypothetical protein
LKLSTSLNLRLTNWYRLWAITPYERLRLRCIFDAAVAELYGLEIDDFAWILQDCDHPTTQVCDKKFARTLEPKGFWRVDKEKDPELRHPVLSLVAFTNSNASDWKPSSTSTMARGGCYPKP